MSCTVVIVLLFPETRPATTSIPPLRLAMISFSAYKERGEREEREKERAGVYMYMYFRYIYLIKFIPNEGEFQELSNGAVSKYINK